MKGCLISLAFVAVLSPATALAQADTSTKGVPPHVTVHLSGGLVSANYAAVVVDLAKAGQLPLRPFVDTEGRTPEAILTHLALLPVGTVPPELDRFLCERNAHVCEISGTRGVWTNQKAPANPVTPQGCYEKDLPRYVICVPDVKVNAFTSISTLKYNSKVDKPVSEIVTGQTEGCRLWNKECQQEVTYLNEGKFWDRPHFAGDLILPTLRLTITIPVGSPDHLRRLADVLDASINRLIDTKQFRAETPRVTYTVANGPLKGGGGFSAIQPAVADSRDILKVMQYPYATLKEFGDRERTVIGVWDQRFDGDHCDFRHTDNSNNAFEIPPDNLPPDDSLPVAPSKVSPCGHSRANASFRSTPWDHGTATAGVVAARENGRGIVGAHPTALVWGLEYNHARIQNNDPILKFLGRHGPLVRVINLSLEDDVLADRRTDLEEYIERWKERMLFTIAAGNNGNTVNRGSRCPHPLGCMSANFNSMNTITVVALASDGRSVLTGRHPSNQGTAFDVAAIGATTTTLHGDATGVMEGTSFAAPYVAALAAMLIHDSRRTLTPEKVRHRVLYTADFRDPGDPNLSFDAFARFGRINFTRALDTEKDLTKFKAGFQTNTDGRALMIKPGETVHVVSAVEDGRVVDEFANKPLDLTKLRRLSFDEVTQKYWVVIVDSKGIRKLDRVIFDPNATITLEPNLRIKINEIQDFTCALECK